MCETKSDPRVNGFNYGAALGKPDGELYAEAQRFASDMGEAAMKLSHHAWALEMALREARNACSVEEQHTALHALAQARILAEADTLTIGTIGKARWFRWGHFGRRKP